MLAGEQRKKLILVVAILLIIEIAAIYMMYQSIDRRVVLEDVQIKELDTNDFVAIMIQQGGSYVNTNNFPTSGYTFNSTLSGCIDDQGNKIEGALSYNNSTRKATVSTGYTSNCYLYFDLA